MLTIVFCKDSEHAREKRSQHFAPHMEHLRGVMSDIRLAAPLATADGAAISNDDRLVASVFAIELESVLAASGLMQSDPYMSHGVWQWASLYAANNQYGEWLSTVGKNEFQGRVYVMFSPDTVVQAEKLARGSVLFGASLKHIGTLGDSAACYQWQSMEFFLAETLEAARSRVAGAEKTTPGLSAQVWAVPLAVGSWPDRRDL